MARSGKETLSLFVLPLATRIFKLNVADLYNKSRMMGDYHVRFCEWLRVKFPLPTRHLPLGNIKKK